MALTPPFFDIKWRHVRQINFLSKRQILFPVRPQIDGEIHLGASRIREDDSAGIKAFLNEYPKATAFLLYGGTDRYYEDKIHFIPVAEFFKDAVDLFFSTTMTYQNGIS
jgi:hypothetical protein